MMMQLDDVNRLDELVGNLHQAGKIHNLHQVCGVSGCVMVFVPTRQMSHGAIFLANCNGILLLRDVNLANTHLHYTLLMYSSHIKQSLLINIS